MLGKNSKSLVERRQKELELYLQTLLQQFPQATPTPLASFLHFHLYVSMPVAIPSLYSVYLTKFSNQQPEGHLHGNVSMLIFCSHKWLNCYNPSLTILKTCQHSIFFFSIFLTDNPTFCIRRRPFNISVTCDVDNCHHMMPPVQQTTDHCVSECLRLCRAKILEKNLLMCYKAIIT